jgi:queuine tRNA-ribosyltransferase
VTSPSAIPAPSATAAGAFRFERFVGDGRARLGRIHTPHGCIDTPAFMPVGTRATVKGLTPAQVAETGAQILLANTYHLLLRPGPEVVAALGGLHRMMGWDKPILTDSGGFQVFSLTDLRKLDDDGATFQSHIDGRVFRLTPESAIAVQNQLGADIIMAFDECPPLDADPPAADAAPAPAPTEPPAPAGALPATDQTAAAVSERPARRKKAPRDRAAEIARAVRRTIDWARRCRAAHARPDQALYGIVQGGLDVNLRRHCLDALRSHDFDGYALGGLSVGEPPPAMWAFLDEFAHELPADRPRYLMGVGTPIDLVNAVAAGIDQFDCVLPTRNGRKAYAFTSAGVVRLRNAAHRTDTGPLDPACDCYTCRTFSRGYLRHLCMVDEPLGATLVSLHNLAFYQSLMRQMRNALQRREFAAWRAAFLKSPAAGPDKEAS